MTTIQAQMFADHALVPRSDFERLLELARRSETSIYICGKTNCRRLM
jgi:hypothetical protein